MPLITADRFNQLKIKIKNECLRRKYEGSVASYGSTAQDFLNSPDPGEVIDDDHYQKIAVPLNAINSSFGNTYGLDQNIISNRALEDAESRIAEYSLIGFTATNTGCSSSCTGLCSTQCSTECTGTCKGGCSSSCTSSCSQNCASYVACSGCSGTCSGSCTRTCASGCDNGGGCTGYCSGCSGDCTPDRCTGGCGTGCTGYCSGGCSGGCYSASRNCDGNE